MPKAIKANQRHWQMKKNEKRKQKQKQEIKKREQESKRKRNMHTHAGHKHSGRHVNPWSAIFELLVFTPKLFYCTLITSLYSKRQTLKKEPSY